MIVGLANVPRAGSLAFIVCRAYGHTFLLKVCPICYIQQNILLYRNFKVASKLLAWHSSNLKLELHLTLFANKPLDVEGLNHSATDGNRSPP